MQTIKKVQLTQEIVDSMDRGLRVSDVCFVQCGDTIYFNLLFDPHGRDLSALGKYVLA